MKRTLWFGLLLAALFWPGIGRAQAGWTIQEFASQIAIQEDGSVAVRETIDVDFGSLEKHGIYRDLPYVYSGENGGRTYTRVEQIEVLQDGDQAEVEITRSSANLRIRIGDPDTTISGRHRYVIFYHVAGVLQSFAGFDELNWNVTGNEWEAPVELATVTVAVPAQITQVACYQGVFGSNEQCEKSGFTSSEAKFSATNLASGQGLTVAVGFEPGTVPIILVEAPPTFTQALFSLVAGIAAALVTGIGVGWFLWRWHYYGRDRYWRRSYLPGERSDRDGKQVPEKILPLIYRQPVSVEYDSPDNLRPAEIGVLLDERADTLDVSATIVDLAVRGFLTITEIPKSWVFGKSDYEFTRTEKHDDGLLKYEQSLLKHLFEDGKTAKMSDLKNSFYTHLKHVKELLYEEVVRKKLFPKNPEQVRAKYFGLGLGVTILGGACLVLAAIWVGNSWNLFLYHQALAGVGVGLLVVGALGIFLHRLMPRKSGYGRELYQRALGYEMFVSGTEKYRAPYYENHNLFVEVLPYAIMFGVTDKLARAFKDMGIEPPAPGWYHGAGTFHALNFASSMNNFSSSVSSAMASKPSSSGSGGGGFSGGGFGGGGGGSW